MCWSLRPYASVGIQSDLGVDEVLARRAHEPWYTDAVVALHAEATSPRELQRYRRQSAPQLYGQWNAQAQATAEPAQFTQPAADGFCAGFEPDPALPERLAALTVPVLLVAGEYDRNFSRAARHRPPPDHRSVCHKGLGTDSRRQLVVVSRPLGLPQLTSDQLMVLDTGEGLL